MRTLLRACALSLVVIVAGSHPASAASQRTFTQTVPFAGLFFGCDSYAVQVAGELRMLEHIDFDERKGGAKMHFLITARASGVSIPALIPYTVLGTDQNTMHLGPLPATTTIVANVHLIGQGSAPNSTFFIHVHITVNANGIPTATPEKFGCRGQAT